jgi:nuclear inhibitor of protein phosphatase 1
MPAPPAPEARRSTPPPQAPVAPAPSGSADAPFEVAPDAPRVIAGFLVSYEGDELGTFWALRQGQNVVGRKGAADGLDVEVDHPTTSSRHAIVHAMARPGRLKVEDPGSTNGTFVNEQKLSKGTPQELEDGDTLRFGGYSVTVKIV